MQPRVSILVGPGSVEVTYDTGEIPTPNAGPMTVGEFADLGLVSWDAGSWKDASWPAGSLSAQRSFELFLDAAAALVAHLGM